MAKKINRMNWSNFPLQFLKAVIYSDKTDKANQPDVPLNDSDMLAPYMDEVFNASDYFIKTYRSEIEDYFLQGTSHLTSVISQLEKLNYNDIHIGKPEDMMFSLKQKKISQTIIDIYRKEILTTGRDDLQIKTQFPRPISIDLRGSSFDPEKVTLYEYQERAVLELKRHFIDNGKSAGILQMPTGSGKTRTAVYFLLTEMITRGYQVLWLAHRSMLIEQAAEVFYKFAPIIKTKMDNPPTKFNMICVSSVHAKATMINKKDNLIVSMVPSLYYNKKRLRSILNDKVIIVVDEAHHTTAPTYRTIIEKIREYRPSAKLLGLSATPTRGTERDANLLWKIFESKEPIFSVTMNQLINNGTLSKPIPTSIETSVNIETMIDDKEIAHIQKMHEMPESLVDKIARTNTRNELIVDHYVKNKDKYGKTIVFALNGIHCMALDDAFKARGIKSGFIYTHNKNNSEIIEQFRNNDHPKHIDVLININMLTEGSDIPDIQTVFLTRPTSSDVLLMQMVGRGMRGINAGGTATCNIVDFCDKWSDITRWFNPKLLFDIDGPIDPIEKVTYEPREYILIPWDLIRAVMRGITYKGANIVKTNTVLPLGWYNIVDESGNEEQILVFENQLASYKKLHEDIKYISDYLTGAEFNARELLIAYFSGFGLMPTEEELQDLINYFKNDGKFPELQSFEERDRIDPYTIASGLKDRPQTFTDTLKQIDKIYDEHREMIDNLYGGKSSYQEKIVNFMQYPNGVAPLGTAIEETEKEFYQLNSEPFSEKLEVLLDEVIREQADILGKSFVKPSIYWTAKEYKSYFAAYNYREERKDDFIVVNKILNSKTMDEHRETLKFLIYHECLHQKFRKHGLEFRELEQQYPDFHTHENFLDRTFPDFVRDYAM